MTLADAYRQYFGYQGGRGFPVGSGYQIDRDFSASNADNDYQRYDVQQPFFQAEPKIDFDIIIAKLFRRFKASEVIPEAPIADEAQTGEKIPAVEATSAPQKALGAQEDLAAAETPATSQENSAAAEAPTTRENSSAQDLPAIE